MIFGLQAFGESAIGELPSAHDLSEPNPLVLLTGGQLSLFTTYAVVATPYDPTASAETTVRLSNNGYRSAPGDAAANKPFKGVLTQPYSASVSVVNAGRITGRSTPVFGDVEAVNLNGENDNLLAYNWDARDWTSYLGRKDQPFDSQFAPILVGKVESITGALDSIRFRLRSLDIKADTPVQESNFMGIGWGVRFDGVNDEISWGNNHDQTTASFTIEALFRGTTTGTQFIFGKRNGLTSTDTGYSLSIGSGVEGKARFKLSDGSNGYTVATSASVTDGEWHRLTGVYDSSADTITVYDDGTAGEVLSTSGMGSLTNAVALVAGEDTSGGNDLTGDVTDFRIWGAVRGQSDIQKDMHRTLTAAETDLDGYWPCDEGTAATVTDNVGAINGTITGGTWIGTGEGGVELAGKPKPLTYGQVTGRPLVLVDPKNLVYQIHDGAVSSVDAVRDSGEALTDEGDVADVWNTSVTSGQFKTDEASGYLRLGADPAGELEADVKGDASGTGYVSTAGAVLRRIATRHGALTDPDDLDSAAFTSLDTDAPYTVGIISDSAVWRSDLMDQLVESIGGWWGFTRQGLLSVGLLKPPEDETATLELTENTVELYGIEEVLVPAPTYRQRVGYRRQWKTLRHSDMAGAMSAAERAAAVSLLTQAYRYATTEDATVQTSFLDAWEEEVPGVISTLADAQTEADRRQVLFGVKRVLYRVPLAQGIYAADIGDIANLTISRLGLDSGQNFIVLGWEEDGADFTQSLLLWGKAPDFTTSATRETVDGDTRETQDADERVTN